MTDYLDGTVRMEGDLSKERDANKLTISVVVPVRDDPENLRRCLQAVMGCKHSYHECIVVDDGSCDETATVARQFPVKVLKLPRPHGPAYARNCGAKAASGEVLFFTDADVTIHTDTLAKIAEAFAQHPEIDALIGSYDDDPGDLGFISQYKNLFHHYVHQNSNENACTFWSGCGAIRRQVFLKCGGFDTSYQRPAVEDIELGYRLTASHHKIVLRKQIQVKHWKRWSLRELLKVDIFDRAIPWTLLILRHRNFPKDLNLQVSQRVSVFLVYLLLLSAALVACYRRVSFTVLALPFLFLAAVVLINLPLYSFFARKRGLFFALMAIPMHLIYYIYSGVSFGLGIGIHVAKKCLHAQDMAKGVKANGDL